MTLHDALRPLRRLRRWYWRDGRRFWNTAVVLALVTFVVLAAFVAMEWAFGGGVEF